MTSLLTLKAALKKRFDPAAKVAFLGIGSELRGDDACGIMVAENLKAYIRKRSVGRKFKVFIGGTAPENITGEIKRFHPAHLVLVDAADLGKRAGQVRLIGPEEAGGISFCTHQLPIKIMVDYLVQSIGCAITIIGVQPKKIDFAAPVSLPMQTAVRVVSGALKEIIRDITKD